MRKFGIGATCAALAVAGAVVPATQASARELPSGDQNKAASWERVYFRSVGPITGTDGYLAPQPWSPPTVDEVRKAAPAADVLGVINIGYLKGDFPGVPIALPPLVPAAVPAIPGVDVPGDFAMDGYKSYVWFNALELLGTRPIYSDHPEDMTTGLVAQQLKIKVPGWNTIADSPEMPDYIATDFTTNYKQWAEERELEGKHVPVMVAHRGGGTAQTGTETVDASPSNVPENSLAAFKRAIHDGAKVLETDVQWTKDGVAVLMHDQTLTRTVHCIASGCPDRGKPVSSYTFADLRKYFVLSNKEPIPTLAAYLDLANANHVGVLPEIKNWNVDLTKKAGVPELKDYVNQVLARPNLAQVLIGSFDPNLLAFFQKGAPGTGLTPVAQSATCLKYPASTAFKVGKTVSITVPSTCKTVAGQVPTVAVSSKSSAYAKVTKVNSRYYKVTTLKASTTPMVTVTYSAPAIERKVTNATTGKTTGYAKLSVVKTYKTVR